MKETKASRRKRFIAGVAIGLASLIAVSGVHADEKVTFFHVDVAGSPVAATNETGDIIWREDYQPYGARINNESEAASNDRWFTGHPHDDDTGLTYAGARYYDPVVGRFMAVDPKGFNADNPPSFNRYAYANNNPYTFVDPDGRDTVTIGPSVRVQTWLGKLIFGPEFIGQGGSVGFAVSFPGLFGGEWDAGVYVEGQAGGDGWGIGRVTVDVSYNKGSVTDLGGDGVDFSATGGYYGGSLKFELDEDNKMSFSGAGLQYGFGINAAAAGTKGRAYTLRGLFRWMQQRREQQQRGLRTFTDVMPDTGETRDPF